MKNAEEYVAALRQELSDLPGAEVDAIVEDITPQLAAGGDELGSPATVATELRAAAGFPLDTTRPVLVARIVLFVLVIATGTAAYGGFISHQLMGNDARYSMPVIGLVLVTSWFLVARLGPDVAAVADLPEIRAIRGLLVGSTSGRLAESLRLVELGWLLARFPLIVTGTLMLAVQFGWDTLMPQAFAVAVGVVTTAAGYRSLTDRRWLWLSVPAGAFAVGTALRVAGFVSLYAQGHIGYLG